MTSGSLLAESYTFIIHSIRNSVKHCIVDMALPEKSDAACFKQITQCIGSSDFYTIGQLTSIFMTQKID